MARSCLLCASQLTKETGIQDYAAESGRASASPESPGADSSGGMVPRRDSVLQTDYRGSPRVSFEAPRVSFDTGAPPSAAEYARSPARGDADWVDEYGFVGDSEGAFLHLIQCAILTPIRWEH